MMPEEIKTKKKLSVVIVAAVIAATVLIFGIITFNLLRGWPIIPVVEESREVILMAVQRALDDEDRDCVDVLAKVEDYLGKNPKDSYVWETKGICEFASRKYEAAKNSFEEVLVLDSGHEAAKNYLESIDNILSGRVIVINPETDYLDRDFVESKLGFSLDPGDYRFANAARLSPADAPALRFSAGFITDKLFNIAVEEVAAALTENNISFEIDLTIPKKEAVVYSIRFSEINEPFQGFSISLFNHQPVVISIFYEK